MEDYAAKMQLKTDAALRQYISGYEQYREAAVLAALDELRRRGQPAPEEATLRPVLEASAAQQQQLDAQTEANRRATEAPTTLDAETTGPSLYSPASILIFSLLPMSTMIAGGVLLGLNLYRLGKKRAVVGLALFMVGYFFVGSVLLNWAVLQHGLHPIWAVLLFNLPAALIYVFLIWPRYVGITNFRSRSTLVPVIICFLVMWGLNRLTPYLIQQQPKEVRQELEKMMSK